MKINKCHFFYPKVEYLGHMFNPRCWEIDNTNYASLRDTQLTTNKTRRRLLLGFCDVNNRPIDDIPGLKDPPNEFLKTGASNVFTLDVKQRNSFHILIDKVSSLPFLALPRPILPY